MSQGFDLPISVFFCGHVAPLLNISEMTFSLAEGLRIEIYLKLQLFYYECFSFLIIE